MNEKITVIVPVYNVEHYLDKCLDSLINQTYKNLEIIVINDGSTDNSLEVIKEYADANDFIRVIDKENEGVAKTRNKGIQLAKGKYVVFIDNDDFVDSDYLERFYNEIDQEQLDIVLGGYKRVNQEMKTLFKQDLTQSEWSKYIVVAPWARIYRTSFLTDNNIQFFDYPIGEDVIFTLTAYNLTDKILEASKHIGEKDYKTVLQEELQKDGDVSIKYHIISESGPDHSKIFVSEVSLNGKVLASGEGRSKKMAEMEAARKALKSIIK